MNYQTNFFLCYIRFKDANDNQFWGGKTTFVFAFEDTKTWSCLIPTGRCICSNQTSYFQQLPSTATLSSRDSTLQEAFFWSSIGEANRLVECLSMQFIVIGCNSIYRIHKNQQRQFNYWRITFLYTFLYYSKKQIVQIL